MFSPSLTITTLTQINYQKSRIPSRITYGFYETSFGMCLLGVADKKICHLALTTTQGPAHVADLQQRWPYSTLHEDAIGLQPLVDSLFTANHFKKSSSTIQLLLKGTPFQLMVWQALLQIPANVVVSYEHVAQGISKPLAARAVGTALGANPIAILIPCHRVIRKSGEIHHYRWGVEYKKALIAWEKGL